MIFVAIVLFIAFAYTVVQRRLEAEEARVDNYFRALGFTDKQIEERRQAILDQLGSRF